MHMVHWGLLMLLLWNHSILHLTLKHTVEEKRDSINEKRPNILVDCRFDLDNVKIRGFESSISKYINEKKEKKQQLSV